MEVRSSKLFFLALAVATSFALSCGTNTSSTSIHQLESITLTPATANAADYPNGQVPFSATGNYNMAPYTVTPLTAGWGACYNGGVTTAITVTQEGVAQCAPGAVAGTYTVWADDPPFGNAPVCNAITACGGGCLIAGTAQLTCGK